MSRASSFEEKVEHNKQVAEQGANRVQGLIHWFTWILDGGRREHVVEVLRQRILGKVNPEFTQEEVETFIHELLRACLQPGQVDDRIHACWPDAPRHFQNNEELMAYTRQVRRPIIVVFPDAENPARSKLCRVRPDGKIEALIIKPTY